MKYQPNKEVIIATYADGGIVASVVNSETNRSIRYHYMCVFEDKECAKNFSQENLTTPVFFTNKKMSTLAREFNSSIVWPGMAGIAYVDNNDMVEYVDTDKLVKMAYSSITDPNKKYGSQLIVDGKIANVEDIDFNKKYYIMFNDNGHLVSKRVYDKNGKRRDWLVVATNKTLINQQADEFKINKKNRKIIKDTLSGALLCFMPGGQMDGLFAGIMYVDKSGSKMISRKKILKLLKDRRSMLYNLCSNEQIYLDAKYFVAADKENGSPTVLMGDEHEFIVVSQNMDVMMKAFELEGFDTDGVLFTNLMTLREIVDGCEADDYDGVAICLDDNPDHVINLTVDEIYDIALDGNGDENECNDMSYIYSDDEYMMAERFVMAIEGSYIIATMRSKETNEMVNVIIMGDNEDAMRTGLGATGYHEENDRVIERPTYEIFSEFRDGGQLDDCDGIMYFDDDGYCLIPKNSIVDTLAEWEQLTDKKSVKIHLDFDEQHCIAMDGYKPLTFTQSDGITFVIVSREPNYLEWALMELFGTDDGITYDNSKTLEQIAESAIFGNMGIAMCDDGGLTFIEPKRLSQALHEDDD